MSDDRDSKTEEPSGKRLGEARSKGQVAKSREVSHAIMIGAIMLVLMLIAPLMARDMFHLLRQFLELPHQMHVDGGNFHAMMVDMSGHLASILALPLLFLMV